MKYVKCHLNLPELLILEANISTSVLSTSKVEKKIHRIKIKHLQENNQIFIG